MTKLLYEFIEDVAEELNVSKEEIVEIINFSIKNGLFSESQLEKIIHILGE